MDRTVESILADWRAAEALRVEGRPDASLEARITRLRAEHAAALEVRRAEAEALARPPRPIRH